MEQVKPATLAVLTKTGMNYFRRHTDLIFMVRNTIGIYFKSYLSFILIT